MIDGDPEYDALRMRYASSLVHKHDDLLQAWHAFRVAPHDGGARAHLHTLAHRLSGSAPSYGYPQLGNLARVIDQSMDDAQAVGTDADAASTALIERLVVPIGALLAALIDAQASSATRPPAIP